MEAKQNSINSIVDIVYLTPGNAEFTLSANNFLQLKATVKYPETLAEEQGEDEEFFFERVFLHRAFPFDNPYKFISVLGNFPKRGEEKKDEEKKEDSPAPPREQTTSLGDLKEIGIISDISVFGEAQKNYLIGELDRKYFTPVIDAIYSVKDKFGFTYWEVKTNIGKIKFTVNDAYRNIIKVSDDRIMVNDVSGNRYEIKSLTDLDRNSFRKIELFL